MCIGTEWYSIRNNYTNEYHHWIYTASDDLRITDRLFVENSSEGWSWGTKCFFVFSSQKSHKPLSISNNMHAPDSFYFGRFSMLISIVSLLVPYLIIHLRRRSFYFWFPIFIQIMLSNTEFSLEKKNDCENNFFDIVGNSTDVTKEWVALTYILLTFQGPNISESAIQSISAQSNSFVIHRLTHTFWTFFFLLSPLPVPWFNALIRANHFCGVVAEPYETPESILYVRFYAKQNLGETKFKFLYTAFRRRNGSNHCYAEEFDCEDDTCIDSKLKCDDNNNCKFKKDEASDCKTVWSGQKPNISSIFAVAILCSHLSPNCLYTFQIYRKMMNLRICGL